MGGEPIAGSTAGCTRQIWLDYKLTVALVIYWLTLLRRAPAAAEASTAEEVSKVHCCGHLSSQWPRLLACTVLMSHSRALCAVLCERARLAAPAAVALLRAFCCCCCFGSLVLPTAVTVTCDHVTSIATRLPESRCRTAPALYKLPRGRPPHRSCTQVPYKIRLHYCNTLSG